MVYLTSCYAPTSQCYLPEIQQLKKNTGFSVSQIQRIRVCDYIKNHKLENDVVVFLFTLWMDISKIFTLVAWIVCGDGQIMRSCWWGVLLKGLENPYRPYVCGGEGVSVAEPFCQKTWRIQIGHKCVLNPLLCGDGSSWNETSSLEGSTSLSQSKIIFLPQDFPEP